MNHRIAVVTGGTRGIGAAISQTLQHAGYKVGAIYHGNEQAAHLFQRQTGIRTYKCDVGDFASCQRTVQHIEDELGPVDILINNAGITRDGMFHKMSTEQWNSVITTNLTSCFNMTRCVIAGMRERLFGRIVNISSINGQKGQIGQVNYAAAKAGIIGFSKALALENGSKGITVNVIAPGYIETEMVSAVPQEILHQIVATIPVGRLGTPVEIARAVLFLVAEESSFITGATLAINGGQYMA